MGGTTHGFRQFNCDGDPALSRSELPPSSEAQSFSFTPGKARYNRAKYRGT